MLHAIHKKINEEEEVNFPFGMESDGTIRLLYILAYIAYIMYNDNLGRNSVCIIDEFDRGLHSLLTSALVEEFLCNSTEQTRHQLIITTHDVNLMKHDMLRRDEIWFMTRNYDGSSSLASLDNFENNPDNKNDVAAKYLHGRYHGIPDIVRYYERDGYIA